MSGDAIAPARDDRERAASDSVARRALRRFRRHSAAVFGVLLLGCLLLLVAAGPLALPYGPNQIDLTAINRPPSLAHLLGTDGVGRDVLVRTVAGGRVSLAVGFGATAISLAVGVALGTLSGLARGATDMLLMRLVDLIMVLPPIVLLLVLASITGPGLTVTVVVIGLLSWPVLARLVRARLLEITSREYVTAAQAFGSNAMRIIVRHGLPNMVDVLVVYATLQMANAVLLEAGLSFIGLGIPPPKASWGNMLNAARSTLVLERFPWQWLSSGIALALTVLAINFVGDGLRDALDPRSDLQKGA